MKIRESVASWLGLRAALSTKTCGISYPFKEVYIVFLALPHPDRAEETFRP
jgi:hypothetical protein